MSRDKNNFFSVTLLFSRCKLFISPPSKVNNETKRQTPDGKFNFGSPVDIDLPSKRAMLTPFVCLPIYLRRHARYSDARRNALASGYVLVLPRAVPHGRTSFHSASWNAFNPSTVSPSLPFLSLFRSPVPYFSFSLFLIYAAWFPVAWSWPEVPCEGKLGSVPTRVAYIIVAPTRCWSFYSPLKSLRKYRVVHPSSRASCRYGAKRSNAVYQAPFSSWEQSSGYSHLRGTVYRRFSYGEETLAAQLG